MCVGVWSEIKTTGRSSSKPQQHRGAASEMRMTHRKMCHMVLRQTVSKPCLDRLTSVTCNLVVLVTSRFCDMPWHLRPFVGPVESGITCAYSDLTSVQITAQLLTHPSRWCNLPPFSLYFNELPITMMKENVPSLLVPTENTAIVTWVKIDISEFDVAFSW